MVRLIHSFIGHSIKFLSQKLSVILSGDVIIDMRLFRSAISPISGGSFGVLISFSMERDKKYPFH